MKSRIKLLAVLNIMLLAGGCAPANDSTSVNENKYVPIDNTFVFDTTKNVSIKFYHTMNGTLMEVLQAALDRFEVLYPNISVTSESAGGYDDVRDMLKTSISADKVVCDMAYCYPDHVALYNQAKSVAVLDNFIDHPEYGFTAEQEADFIPSYYAEGNSFGDGLMYSLPFSKSSEVLFYDKTFFEDNNLSVPTHWFAQTDNVDDDPTSMEYACKKIKELDPASYPLGYDSESNWFITLCEQYQSPYTSSGKDHYLFNNDVNKEFVTKLKGWFDKNYFTTKAIYGQYTSNLFTEIQKDTRCYMCIGSSAGASNQTPDDFSFEVGVAKVPQVDANNGKVISQGPNVCIFRNNDKQKEMACWLLLKFLTTDIAFQADFSMNSGYSPVISSVYRNAIYQEFLEGADGYDNITALSTTVAREQEDWYFTSPAFVGSSSARDQVGSMMVSIFTTNTNDVAKTVNDTFESVINALKGNK